MPARADLHHRLGPHRAAIVIFALAIGLFVFLGAATRGLRAADRVDELSATLEKDPDDKARIAAAVALGRLADKRGVPALIRALGDESPVVRGVAATALGHIGDPRAIPALERTLSDPNESVRSRARDALAALRAKKAHKGAQAQAAAPAAPPPTTTDRRVVVAPKERPRLGPRKEPKFFIEVKSMANKATRGGPQLAEDMRRFVVGNLDASPHVTLDDTPIVTNGHGKLTRYVLDGSIIELGRAVSGPWVEITCKVRMTISTPEGKIVSIVTGGATVQTPRGYFKASMERGLTLDALENAVRGAYQNLMGFLGRQIAAK